MRRVLGWLMVAASLTGCATVFERYKPELAMRAAFELSCPEDRLEYQPLNDNVAVSTVGVTGCGRKSVYVFVDGNWVANNATVSAP